MNKEAVIATTLTYIRESSSPVRWEEIAALLESGFATNYALVTLLNEGKIKEEIREGSRVYLPVTK